MDSDGLGFEVLSSSLRADMADLGTFVEVLAAKLEGALPQATTVERKGGGLFSREKHVHAIEVALGEARYRLAAERGRVNASIGREVRGIVLKTEQVELPEWVDALSRHLAEHAQSSEQARLALERMLG